MNSERSILHIDLDTFFVSCERLLNPSLVGKPIIIGGITGRGVVSSASYEARAFGVYGGMSMQLAKMVCPDAVVIKGNSGTYHRFSTIITEIIKEESPVYEKASFDEFYVDLTGMDRFFGTFKWATHLRDRIIKEVHMPLSFGLSINKTVSKVGTNSSKPNGYAHIMPGKEKSFLAPLPVSAIPGVGNETAELLRRMGAKRIKTVQEMPLKFMRSLLGELGINIWKKCNGIDATPIRPYYERKSIGIERTFEQDTIDIEKMGSLVIAMAENLAFQLRNGNKLTSCVIVRIRYADLSTHTKQKRVPFTAADSTLIETAKDLFNKLYDRRLLIRLIGVRFAKLVEGGHQISFLNETEELANLYQAMDHVRNRFGQDAVKRVIAMGSRGIGRHNPFDGEPPVIPAHRRA